MAHSPEIKKQLRHIYIYEKLDIKRCAQKLNINLKSAYIWKNEAKENGDDWDKVREENASVPNEIEAIATEGMILMMQNYREFGVRIKNRLLSEEELSKCMNGFAKVTAEYNNAMRSFKDFLPVLQKDKIIFETISQLTDLMSKRYPDLLPQFLEILNEYEKEI